MKLVFNMVSISLLIIASANSIASPQKALASATSELEHNNSVYPVSFFEQYTPQNAMSMIRRLPGFSFDEGSEARGFGGNAGNVLIDGVRPTSKSGGLEGALERIPASQVLRIEIIRGGVGAGEAAGQSVVANVVKKAIQTSGTWNTKFVRGSHGVVQPQIQAAMSTKLGEWDTLFDVEIEGEPEYRSIYRESFDANETLTSNENETLESLEKSISMNGEGATVFHGGKLTINASLNTSKWQSEISTDTHLASSNTIDESSQLDEEENNTKAEIGIDWVKEISDWKLRVIALTSAHDLSYENNDQTIDNVSNTENSQYSIGTLETEHIARLTISQSEDNIWSPEFGIEIAKNSLETELSLIENDVLQELEGADVVEELRTEIFANVSYSLASNINVEGSLTAEFSELNASNGGDNRQTFSFVKPRLSANYTINDTSTLTLVAEHTVEQLDFNDFAASSSATEDRTTAGNDSLQPEQVTAFSAIYDWRFSQRGSLNVEAVYENRQDIHEQIFLPSGNDGLGNAGDAKFWFVKTNVSLPVDFILENGLIEVFHSYKDSDFHDPITARSRTIYNYQPNFLKVDFRQDILKYDFSWGLQYKSFFDKTKYYVDEVQKNNGNERFSQLFIETTKFFDVKTRLNIKDVNTARFIRTRYFYEGDRSGLFIGSEITDRERGTEIQLSFSGSF